MLETFTSISSSYFIHSLSTTTSCNEEICCPIPRRPASPAFVSWASKKKRRRSVSSSLANDTVPVQKQDDPDWEACQELQEILFNQLPLLYALDEDEEISDSDSDADVTNNSTSSYVSRYDATDALRTEPAISNTSEVSSILRSDTVRSTPFDPTRSPVKSSNISSDVFIDSFCTDSLLEFSESSETTTSLRRKSSTDEFGIFFLRRGGPKAQRPQLGNSTSSLKPPSGFLDVRTEPVITPPLRAHNPLPMNIAFSNRKASEGTEFGLLSVSPPRQDDEETLLRRARVKSNKKPEFSKQFHPSVQKKQVSPKTKLNDDVNNDENVWFPLNVNDF